MSGERGETEVVVEAWPDRLASEDRPAVSAPFRWRGWIVATDGYRLGAIPDDGREVGECGYPSFDTALAPMGEAPPADAMTFDGEILRGWCGPAEDVCPDCRGEPSECPNCEDGYVECECDCGHEHQAECDLCHGSGGGCRRCESEGVIGRHKIDRIGTIGATRFNRRALADLLDGAPAGPVRLVPHANPEKTIILYGEGWRGLLMPLRRLDDSPWSQTPRDAETLPIESIALTPEPQP